MSIPSHIIEADLTRLSARLSTLEKQVAQMAPSAPAPAALPVDKMQLADYGRGTSARATYEGDDGEEDEEVFANPNLSKADLQELTAAVRDYLEWADPQSHLNETSWRMVSSSARERLERALSVAEKELHRATDA